MNDYSVYSDNTLREKQYEIKKHISISTNDINTLCSAKGIPLNGLCMNYYQNIVLMN
jgi:hypothetical protein|nr:MAG TPA: hypothetical protein [Caudoviricetes sp.]